MNSVTFHGSDSTDALDCRVIGLEKRMGEEGRGGERRGGGETCCDQGVGVQRIGQRDKRAAPNFEPCRLSGSSRAAISAWRSNHKQTAPAQDSWELLSISNPLISSTGGRV
ncbi:unnamed protein product [Pleuronectes platessa]|uniref:Uncharacterized protein n=1 Tax=Pleuronectes platessa TaxID=8262 RepID=A0A9N7VRK1_PLEPL|nr:unnamed protein product [Pleuronectes platessa]